MNKVISDLNGKKKACALRFSSTEPQIRHNQEESPRALGVSFESVNGAILQLQELYLTELSQESIGLESH